MHYLDAAVIAKRKLIFIYTGCSISKATLPHNKFKHAQNGQKGKTDLV
jgi:hypothetical protein